MQPARAATLALPLALATALACSGRETDPSAPAKTAEGGPAEREADAPAAEDAPAAKQDSLPPPDEQYLPVALESVRHASVETDQDRFKLATRGLGKVSASRLPPEVGEYLTGIASLAPDQRARFGAKTLGSPTLRPVLESSCGGADLLESLAPLPPEQRAPLIEERCSLTADGLVEADALARAEPVNLLVAHLAYRYLEANGGCHPIEKELLQIIAAASSEVVFNAGP